MVRWPGKIKADTVISEPFWSSDLLVTSAKLAGVELPSDIVFDGENVLPILTANAQSPHESFYFNFRTHAALRKGEWKIVREKPNLPWQLYNLADDLPESQNLAEAESEKRNELVEEFAKWESTF